MFGRRLLLLVSAWLVAPRDVSAGLRKCCAQDERLAWDATRAQPGYACRAQPRGAVIDEARDMTRDARAWIPRAALRFQSDADADADADADKVNAFLIGVDVEFGAQPACAAADRDTLMQYAGARREDFSLVARDDGQVWLEVLKESSLHDPSVAHAHLFPPSSFCADADADADAAAAAHVVLLCPCSAQLVCARKCCADAHALDERAQGGPRCAAVAQLPYNVYDWLPGLSNRSGDVTYYRLTQAQPSCAGADLQVHVIKNAVNEEAKFLLLADGSIQAVDRGGRVFPADSFCGDFTPRNDELVYYCPLRHDDVTSHDDVTAAGGAALAVGACALAVAAAMLIARPDTPRSAFGGGLAAHAAMLSAAHAAHAVLELVAAAQPLPYAASVAFGLTIEFCAVSGYLWLTALAVDVALTFGGGPGRVGGASPGNRVLLVYVGVAWGGAALWTLATGCVEISTAVPALRPAFGPPTAFFNGRGATWLWLYTPMGVSVAISALLTLYTAVGVRRTAARHRPLGPPPGELRLLDAAPGRSRRTNIDRVRVWAWLVALHVCACALELAAFCACAAPRHRLLADVIAGLRGVAILLLVALATSPSAAKMAPAGDKMAARGFAHGRLELHDLPGEE